jgi:hypothetical protein
LCPSINKNFCLRFPVGNTGIKRDAKKITGGIYIISDDYIFLHNPRETGPAFHRAGADIDQKNHLWLDTISLE